MASYYTLVASIIVHSTADLHEYIHPDWCPEIHVQTILDRKDASISRIDVFLTTNLIQVIDRSGTEVLKRTLYILELCPVPWNDGRIYTMLTSGMPRISVVIGTISTLGPARAREDGTGLGGGSRGRQDACPPSVS